MLVQLPSTCRTSMVANITKHSINNNVKLPVRLIVITLEFTSGTFSGNGILCRSQVKALSRLGHEVAVICAKPAWSMDEPEYEGAVELIEIPVTTWGRLDSKGPWKEFATGTQSPGIISRIAAFGARAIICIDWSSLPVYEVVKRGCYENGWKLPPLVYSSFRIFSRSEKDEENNIMKRMEMECLRQAKCSFVLCKSDQIYAQQNLLGSSGIVHEPKVLLPPLREDVAKIPLPMNMCKDSGSFASARPYFTCCVRLSEEKEPERFVCIVAEMARRNIFTKYNLAPLLCSSIATSYAEKLRHQLKQIFPDSIVQDTFQTCTEMAEMFAATRLNLHPCSYDAFGMTIVEAASQGAPSIVDASRNVGATDLLEAENREYFAIDFSMEVSAIVDEIEALLLDERELLAVGMAAAAKARSYSTEANAQRMLDSMYIALDQDCSHTENKKCFQTL